MLESEKKKGMQSMVYIPWRVSNHFVIREYLSTLCVSKLADTLFVTIRLQTLTALVLCDFSLTAFLEVTHNIVWWLVVLKINERVY